MLSDEADTSLSGRSLHRVAWLCPSCDTLGHCMRAGCVGLDEWPDRRDGGAAIDTAAAGATGFVSFESEETCRELRTIRRTALYWLIAGCTALAVLWAVVANWRS